MSPEARADRQVADAIEHDHLDVRGDEPSAVRSRALRRARAPTRSTSRRRPSRASRFSKSAVRRPGRCSPIDPRGSTNYDDHLPSQTYKASMSYVTGSHNLKVGMSMQHGHFTRNDSVHAQGDRYYLTSGYSPFYVNIFSPLAGWTSRLNYNLGIYGQDSWTMRRLTVSGASGSTSRTNRPTRSPRHRARGCRTGTSPIRK